MSMNLAKAVRVVEVTCSPNSGVPGEAWSFIKRRLLELEDRPHQVPEGMALVPKQMPLDVDTLRAIEFSCGGDRDSEDEREHWLDGTLWIGDIEQDDGSKLHGLHLYCDECPEEGSITIAEFQA